jgi:hypothetical protein
MYVRVWVESYDEEKRNAKCRRRGQLDIKRTRRYQGIVGATHR